MVGKNITCGEIVERVRVGHGTITTCKQSLKYYFSGCICWLCNLGCLSKMISYKQSISGIIFNLLTLDDEILKVCVC